MPIERRLSLLAATVASALLLAGCSSPSAASSDAETITVPSAYGEVDVPVAPERVAAVSYDSPWQLMSLDVTPVATIDYSQWIESYSAEQQEFIADAETIGTYGEINYEALAATEPDLIIGDAYEVDEAAYARLSEIAPTVVVGGGDRGDWQDITREVAVAVSELDSWEDSKAAYEQLRDTTTDEYAEVIAGNSWINFSLGDDAGQFSVQLPTGATGNMVVNEMGLAYGPQIPLEDENNYGYVSLPLEQLGTVFDGVTVALTFADANGETNALVQDIIDTDLFGALPVAQSGHVYPLVTQVTDYRTAVTWIEELKAKVLEPLSA